MIDEMDPPSPPSSPPRISFDPPLFLQRRTAIHRILKDLVSGPNAKFNKEDISSLLDVGCGWETLLIRTLVTCDDELPLNRLGGIDVDLELARTARDGSWSIECLPTADDRWRELVVELYNGDFTDLTKELGRWDAIVSSEVIEHLDPTPLALYAPVLLGTLRPKIFIVTTPNREFNKAFDLPITTPPTFENCHLECDTEGRYWREGVPYPMRHADHRFEWTRAEFQDWANSAAQAYGYDVEFTGVGSLKNGLVSDSSSMHSVVSRELEAAELDDLANQLRELGIAEDPFARANRLWGHCTQIAIFTIKAGTLQPDFPQGHDIRTPQDIHCLIRQIYPVKGDDHYPPSVEDSLVHVFKALPQFIPALVARHWDQIPDQDINWQSFYHSSDEISELESFEATEEELSERRLARRQERRAIAREELASLKGLAVEDIVAVVGEVPLQRVWDVSWDLRRSWRFHFDEFLDTLLAMKQCGGEDWQVQNINGEIMGEKFVIEKSEEIKHPMSEGSIATTASIIPDEGSSNDGSMSPKERGDDDFADPVDYNDDEYSDYGSDSDYHDKFDYFQYEQPSFNTKPLHERVPIEFTLPLAGRSTENSVFHTSPDALDGSCVLYMDPVKKSDENNKGPFISVKFSRPKEFDFIGIEQEAPEDFGELGWEPWM